MTMKQIMAFGLGLGALVSATSVDAQARGNCAPHQQVVEVLAERWGESRQSIALGANGAIVEVFASIETGTWTIVVTRPGGPACLVASGQAYQYLAEALPNTDPGA